MTNPGSSEIDHHRQIRDLATREDSDALQALARWAKDDDQFRRRTALETIGRHPHGRLLQGIILGAFDDPSEYVIRTLCNVVALWQLLEAHDSVVSLLNDTSVDTRRAAVEALGAIWSDADFDLLFRVYKRDKETSVRKEAAWVLRCRATSERWQVLFNAFYADELARHRKWACELAEEFSGSETLPRLSKLTMDADGHVRKAASKAIHAVSTRK